MGVPDEQASGWRTWRRVRWNDALVDAVFRRGSKTAIIRRIDATQAFLARVVGAEEDKADAVREAFFKLFQAYPGTARSLFDASVRTAGWSATDPRLPFFLELYLSLVVASADERTAEIGNYRRRLTELTGIGAGALVRHDLPQLWKRAAEWSERTQAPGIARLVLPEPGAEAIIGISKRLAFPTFADQQRLATLLARAGLDDESPIADLLGSFRGRLSEFSDHFQAEFREFRDRLQRSPTDASHTPFWQALQEIARTSAVDDTIQAARLRLELDPSDPHDARLIVSTDDVSDVPDGWRLDGVPVPGRPVGLVWPDERAGPMLEALQRDAVRAGPTLARQSRALRLGLRNGALVFVAAEFDRWSLADRLAPGDVGWLLCRFDVAERLPSGLVTPSGRSIYRASLPGSRAWRVAGPVALDENALATLSESLSGSRLFEPRMPSAAVHLIGTVDLAGGVYFRRPLLPRVWTDSATAFDFRLEDAGGLCLAEGSMERDADARFRFPADMATTNASRVRFDARGTAGLIASRSIEVVGRCTDTTFKTLSRPSHWLVDDDVGGLRPLDEATPAGDQAGVRLGPASLVRVSGLGLQLTRADNPPGAWSDLSEALAALFVRRQALAARDAIALIAEHRGTGAGVAWRTLDQLVENGFVQLAVPRHWRGTFLVPVAPKAHLRELGGSCRVRIVGLLTELDRLRLTEALAPLGVRPFVHLGPGDDDVGATEFVVSSREEAEAALNRVSLKCSTASPPAGLARLPFASPPPDRELPASEIRWWNATTGYFSGLARPSGAAAALERRVFERTRDLYTVHGPLGEFRTESRRWALIAWAVADRGVVGEVRSDGSCALSHLALSLPPSIAWATLAFGGGVVARDGEGRRHYVASEDWSPIEALSAWIGGPLSAVPRAVDIFRNLALRSGQRAVAVALSRRSVP
jgi:hypothetical protein